MKTNNINKKNNIVYKYNGQCFIKNMFWKKF